MGTGSVISDRQGAVMRGMHANAQVSFGAGGDVVHGTARQPFGRDLDSARTSVSDAPQVPS